MTLLAEAGPGLWWISPLGGRRFRIAMFSPPGRDTLSSIAAAAGDTVDLAHEPDGVLG